MNIAISMGLDILKSDFISSFHYLQKCNLN